MRKSSLGILLSILLLNSPVVYAQTAAEFVHLGNMAGRQSNYKDAILNYTKAIEEEPDYYKAYYNRGYTYIETKKYKLAMADLDKVIELNSQYAAAYHLHGVIYFFRKKYDKAIADYSRAIELDPTNIRYYDSRLSVYFRTGNRDKAWKDVIKIQGLGGTVNPSVINMLKNKKYRE